MTPEMLKTELERAEDAEQQSDEQLRQLVALIDRASMPNATLTASDCAKQVASALALNERLRDRAKHLRALVRTADSDATQR